MQKERRDKGREEQMFRPPLFGYVLTTALSRRVKKERQTKYTEKEHFSE